MSTSSSIQSLVESALSGAAEGWYGLVDRFSPMIWSISRASGLNPSDSEDVAQVVFTKLVKHLGGIRNVEALPQWVVVTTKREAWRTKALSRRTSQATEHQLDQGDTDQDDDFEQLELSKHEVREALLKIDPRCQELLTALFGDQNASYDQAADQLGLNPNSIGATRGRCLEALLSQFDR